MAGTELEELGWGRPEVFDGAFVIDFLRAGSSNSKTNKVLVDWEFSSALS